MSARNKSTVRDQPHERTSSYRLSGKNRGPAAPIVTATATDEELSTRRLNVMRFGYAFIGVGLAIVKWPVLIQDARSLPVMDGVVVCLLTAMSLLAFIGLRYPVRMLPLRCSR